MTIAIRTDTTEVDRILAVKAESQIIGEFLDWLNGTELLLAKWVEPEGRRHRPGYERLVPAPVKIEELLARYFGIDLDRAERERRAILAMLRARVQEGG